MIDPPSNSNNNSTTVLSKFKSSRGAAGDEVEGGSPEEEEEEYTLSLGDVNEIQNMRLLVPEEEEAKEAKSDSDNSASDDEREEEEGDIKTDTLHPPISTSYIYHHPQKVYRNKVKQLVCNHYELDGRGVTDSMSELE